MMEGFGGSKGGGARPQAEPGREGTKPDGLDGRGRVEGRKDADADVCIGIICFTFVISYH